MDPLEKLRKSGRTTISVDEAAVLLHVGRNTAYRAAKSGEMPTLRLGKRYLVPVAVLLRMLETGSK